MRNYLDEPGFGDRAAAEGKAIEVPPDAEKRMRAGESWFMAVPKGPPEPDDDDEASPLWTAVAAAGSVAVAVTTWFLVLAGVHAGSWTAAEVTAPVWGLALFGAAATLAVGVGLATVDAWDAHCARRATRRDRRP